MNRLRPGAFFFVIVFVNFASAGGPLRVTGSGANSPGQPFVWGVNPIPYTVDSGPLSATPAGQVVISNAQGLARVASMFQNWQSVPTSSISYVYAGPITGPGLPSGADIKTIQDFNAVQGLCNSGSQNPIVFDADGSLLRSLGLDPLVIGFTSTCKLDVQTGHILSALIVMNGEFQDGISDSASANYELTADQFDEAITHEMGHFSGLDHSQINLDLFESAVPGNCNLDELAGLPLMFPVEFCQARKSVGLPLISPDDAAWISKLYPGPTYSSNYGIISGFVLFADGISALQGVNVIAREVDDPATPQDESKRMAVSVVSGFLFTGNPGQPITGNNTGGSALGGRDPALIGYYEIPVPPGTYTVQVENIDPSFAGGSSVGPLNPPINTYAAAEYWHEYESAYDDPSAKGTLTVQAGQKLSNINFILNQTQPLLQRFDLFEDGEVWLLLPRRTFTQHSSSLLLSLEGRS